MWPPPPPPLPPFPHSNVAALRDVSRHLGIYLSLGMGVWTSTSVLAHTRIHTFSHTDQIRQVSSGMAPARTRGLLPCFGGGKGEGSAASSFLILRGPHTHQTSPASAPISQPQARRSLHMCTLVTQDRAWTGPNSFAHHA